jgi:putative membrane protein
MTGNARTTHSHRWPARIYQHGQEPDVRFSLANERTFLAWTRTSLALLAAGVALDSVEVSLTGVAHTALVCLLLLLGLLCAACSWWRWAQIESALRRAEALPAPHLAVVVAAVLTAVSVVLLVVAL